MLCLISELTRMARLMMLGVIELPFGVFEKDVIESINELEFIPAKINGEPIEVRYRMPIHFKG